MVRKPWWQAHTAHKSWQDQQRIENRKMVREDIAILTDYEKTSKLDAGHLDFSRHIEHSTPVYVRVKYAENDLRNELSLGDYSLLLPLADRFNDSMFATHCLNQILQKTEHTPDKWDVQAAYSAVGRHCYLVGDIAKGKVYYETALATIASINEGDAVHNNVAKAIVMRNWMTDVVKYAGDLAMAQKILKDVVELHYGSHHGDFMWKANSFVLIDAVQTQFVDPDVDNVKFVDNNGKIVSYKKIKQGEDVIIEYTGPDGTGPVRKIKVGK